MEILPYFSSYRKRIFQFFSAFEQVSFDSFFVFFSFFPSLREFLYHFGKFFIQTRPICLEYISNSSSFATMQHAFSFFEKNASLPSKRIRFFQHGGGENTVPAGGIVDKDVGNSPHQSAILYDGTAAHSLYNAAGFR